MLSQKAIVLRGEEFDSLYDRGVSGTSYDPVSATPRLGFVDNTQCRYTPWGIQCRPGYESNTILGSAGTIVQVIPYQTNNTTTHASITGYLVVTHNAGSTFVYDSNSATPTVAVDSIAGSFYISTLCIFGRIIFTYHDYNVGTNSAFQVLKPGQVASRDNGGNSPNLAGVNFASSGTAGNVTQGVHLFGIAYETDTGHITALSTTTGTNVSAFTLANANEQVTATGLPSPLPSGMVKTWILASRVITNFSGTIDGYELFFVASDTGTGSVTFNFTDQSLVDSADYLYDLFGSAYSQLGFTFYAGRLIGWGETYAGGASIGPSYLRVSEKDDPESISLSHGLIAVYPDDGSSGVKNCFEYQGLLIIQKDNKTFVTRDNGDEPNTWDVSILDGTIGGILNGVSRSLDTVGTTRTLFAAVVSKSGIYNFDGKFSDRPLTWKIERLWQNLVDRQDYIRYQIVDIPNAKLFITLVQQDADDDNVWRFLVCDYSLGFDAQYVRWSIWDLTNEPVWIALNTLTELWFVQKDTETNTFKMTIGTESSELLTDAGEQISNGVLETGELPFGDQERSHYILARLRGVFTGVDNVIWVGDTGNSTLTSSLPGALGLSGDITQWLINQDSFFPRFRLEFFSDGTSFVFRLKRFALYGKVTAQDMPNP